MNTKRRMMRGRLLRLAQDKPWQALMTSGGSARWSAALLLALFAWLMPQGAWATHVDDTWKYQVSLNGSNTIRIQVPVYDQEGADCWVSNGNLKVTWDGVTKTCFHWQRNGDTDSDSKDIYVH
ncbi:MAG: hypothetical protein J5965_01575, partial [Aeriscardovia sp.]|nr:hypothetical protein [Aeriscardovia sp.]